MGWEAAIGAVAALLLGVFSWWVSPRRKREGDLKDIEAKRRKRRLDVRRAVNGDSEAQENLKRWIRRQ